MGARSMSKTNLLKLLVLATIVAGAIFFALRSRQPAPPQVGEAAPDFTLPTLTGQSISLRDYRRSVVVVNFWATWCPPCVEEMPSLNEFAERGRGLGVTVIGVSVDQDRAALEQFVAHARLSFPIARDPEQAVAARYGTFKFPESYVIDSEGRIARRIIGALDWRDPEIISFLSRLARSSDRPAQ
jgi:cytochrome c biogenesis protein CcmG/thiol:disulfide interchange protein DsbE